MEEPILQQYDGQDWWCLEMIIIQWQLNQDYIAHVKKKITLYIAKTLLHTESFNQDVIGQTLL